MGFRHPATWIILITLIIVVFGASRLPDITRNIGKSLKIFKEEVRDLQDDSRPSPPAQQPLPPAPQQQDPTIQAPQAPTPSEATPPPAPNPPQTPPNNGN